MISDGYLKIIPFKFDAISLSNSSSMSDLSVAPKTNVEPNKKRLRVNHKNYEKWRSPKVLIKRLEQDKESFIFCSNKFDILSQLDDLQRENVKHVSYNKTKRKEIYLALIFL